MTHEILNTFNVVSWRGSRIGETWSHCTKCDWTEKDKTIQTSRHHQINVHNATLPTIIQVVYWSSSSWGGECANGKLYTCIQCNDIRFLMHKKGGIIANGKLSAMNTLTMHYHAPHTSAGLLSVQWQMQKTYIASRLFISLLIGPHLIYCSVHWGLLWYRGIAGTLQYNLGYDVEPQQGWGIVWCSACCVVGRGLGNRLEEED